MNSFHVLAFVALMGVAFGEDIFCYQCKSLDDEKCSSSELSDLTSFKKKCDDLTEGTYKGNQALGCRKITQHIEQDAASVIRECAYTGNDVDGQKKTGNWAVSKYIYQCTNDQADTPCNSTPSTFYSGLVLLISFVIARY